MHSVGHPVTAPLGITIVQTYYAPAEWSAYPREALSIVSVVCNVAVLAVSGSRQAALPYHSSLWESCTLFQVIIHGEETKIGTAKLNKQIS